MPPKSPILPKKTGKIHKVKTSPDQWISRETVSCPVFEKEPLLPLRILNARRNAIFLDTPLLDVTVIHPVLIHLTLFMCLIKNSG